MSKYNLKVHTFAIIASKDENIGQQFEDSYIAQLGLYVTDCGNKRDLTPEEVELIESELPEYILEGYRNITYYLIGDADVFSLFHDGEITKKTTEEDGISWTIANSKEHHQDLMQYVSDYGYFEEISKENYDKLMKLL